MNYLQRLAMNTWRKKTSLLVASGLLTIILFGLHYSRIDKDVEIFRGDTPATITGFPVVNPPEKLVQNGWENEQQLGIPFVNLNHKKPFIPGRRIVHLDLKGAPPVVSYFRRLFPVIRTMGATGILLEYEDMFPFSGTLQKIRSKNAYSLQDVKELLQLAQQSNLEVIPLVQTFGHLEFALKHAQWRQLREVPGSPQALCPSRNSSLDFVQEIVRQVMEVHSEAKYLHIGCDEVFQMGECELCRLELHDNLFLSHVKNVASIIKKQHKQLKLIIWDDMLRHLSQQSLQDYKIGQLVEPMIWVYAEDIYRFVQPAVWEKYSMVFRTAWTASAFKGAFGETLYVPNAKRHLENNLRWLEVMNQQQSSFKEGFAGIVLTGWQRYDHFAVLCELLPAAIPSLGLSLTAVSNGFFNSSLRDQFLNSLTCPASRQTPFINLETDPFLWDKLGRCLFPGNAFFRLTYRLHNSLGEAKDYLDLTNNQKGWMTLYNIRHNYSLALRVDELTGELSRIYHGLSNLAHGAIDSMVDIFDNYTIAEWIEQKIYPVIIELEKIQNNSLILKSVDHWPARPLKPLKDLQRLGISLPV